MSFNILEKLKLGKEVFGTWCMLPSSFTVDVIARTGLDFIVIDLEHGSISLETCEEMVKTAILHNCHPIVRVGDDQENTILHALETGCEGILVPHVSKVEKARAIVDAARYFPYGKRGLSPYTRCHEYTHVGLAASMKKHGESTFVGILVEGQEGINNLAEIVKVEGIDCVYLGMYDISQSVGLPGQLEHPDVIKQLEICLQVILNSGKTAGTFVRDIQTAKLYKEMGFNFIAFVADSFALSSFYKESVLAFQSK
ncbi:hypothetical protein EHQ92_12835 [Leptospira biflexa]|uniref:HpcH/HpaI aldolase family protein n=1 Tax=Leptospira biflexa TaxID=172 RepID=UPI0010918070|nr:aldolase/citrate lyase family protein [Leptospira biflexa]TGM44519.1 hypothetical protein EHQ92_12835 [Leptospira biflexa]TGM45439.1 hypothetical protein EHQ88_14665 [Leptospira biflexa]